MIPPTGYIQIYVNKLKSPKLTVAKAILIVLVKFAADFACLSDMVATNCLAVNLDFVLINHPELYEHLCDVLVKIFESNKTR